MINLFNKSKQTIFAFGSNIIYTFAIWFTAIVINYYFGAKTLGEYSLIQAIVSPIALFFHLQLKVLATLESNIKNKFSQYLNVYIFSELIFVFIVLIVGLVLDQSLLFYSFVGFKIVESLIWLVQGYHQSNNNFYEAFLISIIRSVVLLTILWGVLGSGFSISVCFFIITVIWLILFFVLDLPKLKKDGCKVKLISDLKILKPLLLSGASLSIISSLDAFIVAIPRYFMKGYFNDLELGKFTMVLQFFIASTIFVVSVGHPFLVKLKHLVNNNDIPGFLKEVKKTFLIFLMFSIFIILFFIFSSNYIMNFFWGEEYENLGIYLTISMIGIVPLFLSSVFVYAINALKFYTIHIKYYPVVVLSSLLFSFYFIPVYGVLGGVIAIVLTQFVRVVSSGLALRYCLRKINSNE